MAMKKESATPQSKPKSKPKSSSGKKKNRMENLKNNFCLRQIGRKSFVKHANDFFLRIVFVDLLYECLRHDKLRSINASMNISLIAYNTKGTGIIN